MNYFEPDVRWELYGINNFEDFKKQFVVTPKFHSKVHEDILKDYETVERIMAFSYYHWPLYDEALKKLLGMVEMSVKLRCQQLSIPLETIGKNNNKRAVNLQQLMRSLLKKEPDKPLEFEYDKARTVRNIFAHPNQHSFVGAIVYHSLLQVINTINYTFVENAICKNALDELGKVQESIKPIRYGNFVLEYDDKRYLSYGCKCLETHPLGGDWVSIVVFYPVITKVKEQIERHVYSSPIYLSLKNLKLIDKELKAVNLFSGETIKLYETNKSENTERFNKFRQELKCCSKQDIEMFKFWISEEMGKALVKHRYQYYWE